MSHACEAPEVQRFPVLRRKLEDVMGKFLRDGIKPAERMIGNMIEMEVILCSFLEISLLISKSWSMILIISEYVGDISGVSWVYTLYFE